MSVNPMPAVYVDGIPIPYARNADGSLPPLAAVGRLSVPWGRRSLFDQPTPATTIIRVLDTSPTAQLARRRDLKGRELYLGWTTPDSYGTTFRGRVTDVDAEPRGGGRRGFLVTIAASSKEVDAANYRAPEGTSWPGESAAARLNRIRALMPSNVFAAGITMPTREDVGLVDVADPSLDFGGYPVAGANVGGRDALSLLRGLWRSLYPMPLVYDPAVDGLGFIRSRGHRYDPNAGGTIVGQLVADANRGGRYVVKPAPTTQAVALDAGEVPMGGPLSQPLEQALTRVEVSYTDPNTLQQAVATAEVAEAPSEALSGRRTLTVESILRRADLAQQLAYLWSTLATEAAEPALVDPIVYRPTRLGGFPDLTAVFALLAGKETRAELYLGRSWMLQLGARPLFGVIGGTIVYENGEWTLQLVPAPVAVDEPVLPPITANTAAAYLNGTPETPAQQITLADLDRSVAVGDLRNVHIGAGHTYESAFGGF